ncbi:uncharacterized protein [Typha angustifolia]|uniref:uncharacterized protein isoform X2 n=1 Tax=Typha angustifolia TaxID=59011 RepID=UPI003C2BA57D
MTACLPPPRCKRSPPSTASCTEGVDEMIKYLANEPSVGLFFVQEHARGSMPHLLNAKDKVAQKIHEVTLDIEDIEDSISVVRSMAENGFPIADDMLKDIHKSLLIMSTSQPKRGNPSWGFQVGRSSSSTQDAFNSSTGNSRQGGGSSRGYLSSVLNSTKQRAAGVRWSRPDEVPKGDKSKHLMPCIPPQTSVMGSCTISTPTDAEGDELPLSSHLLDGHLEESATVAEIFYSPDVLSMIGNYDKFKSEQELKLQDWFQDSQDHTK